MTSKFLPAVLENAVDDAEDALRVCLRGKASTKAFLALCTAYRIAGISALFINGTAKQLKLRLHQSGRAFAHGLKTVDGGKLPLSKYLPLFDALGAGDFDAAAEIAQHARRTHAQGLEYEEDFLFVDFLLHHAFLDAPVPALEARLERWEKVLERTADSRLDVCRALLEKDSRGFNRGVSRWLRERKALLEEQAEGITPPEELKATEWSFSVVGLALVNLADRQKLRTEPEYLHVPSTARRKLQAAFRDDTWRTVELP